MLVGMSKALTTGAKAQNLARISVGYVMPQGISVLVRKFCSTLAQCPWLNPKADVLGAPGDVGELLFGKSYLPHCPELKNLRFITYTVFTLIIDRVSEGTVRVFALVVAQNQTSPYNDKDLERIVFFHERSQVKLILGFEQENTSLQRLTKHVKYRWLSPVMS